MEPEVIEAELVLPTHLNFKRIQMYEKYPKGQSRGRHWKHLKQILQAENYHNYSPDEPNYVNIESPPSMHPCKKICDITGYEAPYYDPRTTLRYANADIFKVIRALPNEYVQRYLAMRNAAVILRKHILKKRKVRYTYLIKEVFNTRRGGPHQNPSSSSTRGGESKKEPSDREQAMRARRSAATLQLLGQKTKLHHRDGVGFNHNGGGDRRVFKHTGGRKAFQSFDDGFQFQQLY